MYVESAIFSIEITFLILASIRTQSGPQYDTSHMVILILKIFIIAVKENMIDIFYFGPLILKTVELCLKKVSACYRDRDLFNMAKMTAKHQKLCDPL